MISSKPAWKPINKGMSIMLALAALGGISGCSWFSSDSASEPEPEPEAKEIAVSTTLSTDAPEPDLIRVAKRLYQAGMYSLARESLQSLHDRYPMGAYAVFAELKLADSYFYNSEFSDAAKQYEQFIKDYPGSPDLPYARLQAARSYVGMSKGTGRDRSPLEKALEMYDSVVTQYPDSSYAALADRERRPVIDQLADYDRLIIDFYQRRENSAAVEARRKVFEERWGTRLKEAQGRYAEADRPLGNGGTARASASIVEAQRVAARSRPDRDADHVPVPVPVRVSRDNSLLDTGSRGPVVQRVTCKQEAPALALIELSRMPPELSSGPTYQKIESTDGLVRIAGLSMRSIQPVYNCFGQGDLRITDRGDLELKHDTDVIVSTIQNPPRLLLAPVE